MGRCERQSSVGRGRTRRSRRLVALPCAFVQHFTSHSQCAMSPCSLTFAVAGNVMQSLEDRTEKSRREMDLHDTIDTVRVLNARNQHIDIDKVSVQVICAKILTSLSNTQSCFRHCICVSFAFTMECRLSRRGARTTRSQSSSAAGAMRLPSDPIERCPHALLIGLCSFVSCVFTIYSHSSPKCINPTSPSCFGTPSRASSRRNLVFFPSASSDDDVKHIEFASKVQTIIASTQFTETTSHCVFYR
jgi:hypothetical protein